MKYPCSAMIKIHIPKSLVLGCFCLITLSSFANNIQVSNVVLLGRNTSAGSNNAANFTQVQFNLSWENSWRVNVGASNWDAAWVFVKFQVGASNPVFTNVNSSGDIVTVSNTTNLRVGMPVMVTSGTGSISSLSGTTISEILNSTQFRLSVTPATALSNATITCARIWEHATISNTTTHHIVPNGSTIEPATDGTGAFIYRSSEGIGTFSLNDLRLRWNYGINGVRDDALVNVQVFAIEMVYVPGGLNFNVGGTATVSPNFIPTNITGDRIFPQNATNIPTGWPNGYNAFYCMKYEISQGQFRDFLNALSIHQQETHSSPTASVGSGALSSSNNNRNGIDIQVQGSRSAATPAVFACNLDGDAFYDETLTDGEWIACNFLSWPKAAAYADWSGLRPMTEMEYEKACRGSQAAVSNEYAWGTATGTAANNITNSGANNESTNTVNANAAFNNQTNVQGPLRVGVFATSSSNRIQSGASYYGIMELSGNLWERTISTFEGNGTIKFNGLHGDGTLTRWGNANVPNWPGYGSGGEVTDDDFDNGTIFRGGSYADNAERMGVSDRLLIPQSTNSNPKPLNQHKGFRAVRTAQ